MMELVNLHMFGLLTICDFGVWLARKKFSSYDEYYLFECLSSIFGALYQTTFLLNGSILRRSP